jgi:hypothetical protein
LQALLQVIPENSLSPLQLCSQRFQTANVPYCRLQVFLSNEQGCFDAEWFVMIHKKYETLIMPFYHPSVMVLLLFLFDIENLARLGGAFNILIFSLLNAAVIILRKRTLPR